MVWHIFGLAWVESSVYELLIGYCIVKHFWVPVENSSVFTGKTSSELDFMSWIYPITTAKTVEKCLIIAFKKKKKKV